MEYPEPIKGVEAITRGFSAAADPYGSAGSGTETAWIAYFSVYFKFGFFTFCTPFYYVYNQTTRKYKLQSFPIQKVVCGVVQVLSLLVLVTTFRIIRAQDLKKNPMLYIELASLALNSFYQVGVLYTFWFKDKVFTDLFNELKSTSLRRFSRGDIWKMKVLTVVICAISWIQALLTFLYGIEEKQWVFDEFMDIMEKRGKHMFFMSPQKELGSAETGVVMFLYLIASFYGQLMKNTADIVGILSVLLFRHVLNDLLYAMQDPTFTPQQLQISYDAFKHILNCLNNAVGFFTFFFFLGPVPYYAINIVTMLDASDALLLLSNCVYLLNYFTTIILAARVNNSAQDIKDWITGTNSQGTERFSQISPPKLDLMLHDLTEAEIALSGYGFFSATSGLVGTIVSLILTYAILVVQFKADGGEPADADNSTKIEANATALLLNYTQTLLTS